MINCYLFVDESGNPSVTDCYALSALWCFSEYDDPAEILKPTRDRIANQVVNTEGELKGEDLSDTKLNSTLFFTRKVVKEDNTIVDTRTWATDNRIAFTIYDSDSDTGRRIAENHFGEGSNSTVSAQLVALASVSSPALRLDQVSPIEVDEYHIILDGDTWNRAGETLSRIYSSIEWAPDIDFSYRDSRNTPGIQIADLAAHTRRKRLHTGDSIKGSQVLDELRY